MLHEFEAALPTEDEPDLTSAEEARRLHTEALRHLDEGIRDVQTAARQANEAARLSVQFHELAEARRAEEVQRAEQLRQADEARRAEEAQRAEQLRQADEARRAEDARERAEVMRYLSDEVRQAQAAAREAGDAARVAKESVELAQQVTAAAMKWMRHSRYVTAAVAFLIGPIVSTTVVRYTDAGRKRGTNTLAREENAQPERAQKEEPLPPTVPDEEADTANLEGGTAMTEALLQSLPLPSHGVPGQRAAPCPAFYDEISGYCWTTKTLTSEQVKGGACEQLRLYEPSLGWCRAHRAGYLPVYASRKDNNAVEPQ